jgi:hypothetical protein
MELILLITVVIAAWFWLDSLSARDIAVATGRQAAEKFGLQLLDDTVAISKMWAARDSYGRLRLQRTYSFEVSDTGADRLQCSLTLLGMRIERIDIPPHRDRDNVIPLFH